MARQEIALKVMGKTLDEINKNDKLKRTYEDLQRIGEQMNLPEAGNGQRALDDFSLELQRFKMACSYAFHAINFSFLNQIAEPLDGLRKGLEEMRKNLMMNMPKISNVIGTGLGWIMRLVIAGVRGIKDFIEIFMGLPDNIKAVAGGFAGLWAVFKASPIMWVLAGLTALLLLLDDFQAYKDGLPNALGWLWEGLEEGTVFDGLNEKIDGAIATLKEKLKKFVDFGEEVSQSIVDGVLGHDFEEDGEKIGGFINKLFTAITSFLNDNGETIGKTAENTLGAIGGLVGGIFDALGSSLEQIDFKENGKNIGEFITQMFKSITKGLDTALNGLEGEGGLFEGLYNAIKGLINSALDLLSGVFEGLKGAEIASSLTGLIESAINKITTTLKVEDFNELGEKAGKLIIDAIEFAGDFIGELASWMWDQLTSGNIAKLFQIGVEIGAELLSGIWYSLGDWLVGQIWDDEEVKRQQQTRADQKNIRKNQTVGWYTDESGETRLVMPNELASARMFNVDFYSQATQGRANNIERSEAIEYALRDKSNPLGGAGITFERGTLTPETTQFLRGHLNLVSEDAYDTIKNMEQGFTDAISSGSAEEIKKWADAVAEMQQSWNSAQGNHEKLVQVIEDTKAKYEELTSLSEEPIVVSIGTEILEPSKQKVQETLDDWEWLETVVKPKLSEDSYDEVLAKYKKLSEPITTPVKPQVQGTDKRAVGGRIASPTYAHLAETGEPEYIIPIKRPERAKGLILQMLAEMGSGAKSILESFGIDGSYNTIDDINKGIIDRAGVVGGGGFSGNNNIKTNSDNVFTSNPTVIVYSNDPYVAGQTAADATGKALLRQIRGSYGY